MTAASAPVTHALIPCGGKGTRMLSLTGGAPKELVPVAGVPMLHRVVRECTVAVASLLHAHAVPGLRGGYSRRLPFRP